jgi:hypothetical protein
VQDDHVTITELRAKVAQLGADLTIARRESVAGQLLANAAAHVLRMDSQIAGLEILYQALTDYNEATEDAA